MRILKTELILNPLSSADYPALKEIYEAGIKTGNATLQTEAPDWKTWDSEHLLFGRLGAFADEKLTGWAALIPVSGRCVYSGVAEVSVYIRPDYQGQGIGELLLNKLISESEDHNIWTLQAGILKENIVSVKLHQKCGFRVVGLREKLGKLHGAWRDIYLLERRSNLVGV